MADLSGRLHTREVGGQAVWSVTTAKAGNGVEMLRDDRDDTYWQSDGAQPHLITINFPRKVRHRHVHALASFEANTAELQQDLPVWDQAFGK